MGRSVTGVQVPVSAVVAPADAPGSGRLQV